MSAIHATTVSVADNGSVDEREETYRRLITERLITERLAQVEAQRDELTRAIADMRLARSLTFADDEHDPEGSTVSLDQARDVALLDRTNRSVAELQAAADRLTAGTYGRCELCGGAIPSERLVARPEARRCVSCARAT
jgi:DnaK suppressor protein